MRDLTKRALKLGFTPPFIARLSDWNDRTSHRLDEFLGAGYHGTMHWMADSQARRRDPRALWPEARSAVIFGQNYGPETDPMATLAIAEVGTISVYARARDYHDVIKGQLKELAGLLVRQTGADVKVFVDTAPLMEKPLAQLAGLGWQGKHTNLVSRDYGSWLFIGVILSAADLPATGPQQDHCGQCQACLDICPTQAFPAPYQLDARRCISYLTIEHAGPVDAFLRAKLGNHIYGCDDCLAVCPWNKFAQTGQNMKLKAKEALNAPRLADLARLGEAGFRQTFSGSPIKRIGWARFLRNVLYAIGNSRQAQLRSVCLEHVKSDDLVVRDAARWAATRLLET